MDSNLDRIWKKNGKGLIKMYSISYENEYVSSLYNDLTLT
jgi:hypothetical protein